MIFSSTRQLNNKGVESLRSGQYDDAMELFQRAIYSLKALEVQGAIYHQSLLFPSFLSQNENSEFSDGEESSREVVIDNSEDEVFFLVKRAFLVPDNLEPTPQTMAELCIIVTHNGAITEHMRALKACRPAERNTTLYHAIELYEEVYRCCLLTLATFPMPRKLQSKDMCLLTMSILNNLGVIHYDLGQPQRGAACFHQLLNVLEVFLHSDGKRAIGEEEYVGFFLNVIASNAPVSANAA